MWLPRFDGISIPVPVDPGRPDGETRPVEAGVVVSKLFEVADSLNEIKIATRADELKETRIRRSAQVVIPVADTFVATEPIKVPQGSIWELLSVAVLWDTYQTDTPNGLECLTFRNTTDYTNFVGAAVPVPSVFASFGGALQSSFDVPIIYNAGEGILSNIAATGTVAGLKVSIGYEIREWTRSAIVRDIV